MKINFGRGSARNFAGGAYVHRMVGESRQCRIIYVARVARVANATGLGPQRGLRKSKKLCLMVTNCFWRTLIFKAKTYLQGGPKK